jgi:hypothetical protein
MKVDFDTFSNLQFYVNSHNHSAVKFFFPGSICFTQDIQASYIKNEEGRRKKENVREEIRITE